MYLFPRKKEHSFFSDSQVSPWLPALMKLRVVLDLGVCITLGQRIIFNTVGDVKGENLNLTVGQTWVQILSLPLTFCVPLGESLYFYDSISTKW